jgi:eukaryotic-like serine/threonine-protein kinase
MTDAPTPEVLRPGSVVGPWRIEGYAGRGTYGLVFRARLAGYPGSPLVALKVAAFAYDPRFVREAGLLSRPHHPAIPRLLDRGWWIAGPEAAYPYLVLEWIRGLPLYEWARENQATSRQVLRVLAQVAGALAVLHQADSLHRDVKGDNILVDAEGRAVLMDYGSSTWAGAPPLTESPMPPNTREYRSPEALRFEWAHWRTKGARYQARPADDLHALGVSMYRLVTRVYPPKGTEPEELKERLQAPPPRRLPAEALNAQVVPELSALIERLLADEPEARGSAYETEEAAEAAVNHVGPHADAPLFHVERPELESGTMPARLVPASGSMPPAAKTATMPVQHVLVAGAARPAVETVATPVRIRAQSQAHEGRWRQGLAAAALVFALVGSWWLGHGLHEQVPHSMQAAVPDSAEAPDAGPAGLGDDAQTARQPAQDVPASAKTISLEMPKEPLPGQRRAPCGRGEVEIHGGCWVRWPDLSPPCGEKAYEWKGACYLPFTGGVRVPTTQKPR